MNGGDEMMEPHHDLRFGYIALAAMAGAITALAFMRWRDLSWGEMALTLVAGFSFAVFVTPWAAHAILRVDDDNVRTIAALTYIFGSGSNVLLPALIRRFGRLIGHEEPQDE